MPLDDSSETNFEVHVLSPLTSETATLNPHNDEQGRRYSLRDRKEPDRLGFSKSSSNVVYLTSDFVSYHCLSKAHLAFALQLSFVSILSHFLEAFEDPMEVYYGRKNESSPKELYLGDGRASSGKKVSRM